MRIPISRRFTDNARALWLVAKRNGCNKDLRRLLVAHYVKNAFAWETETLVEERKTQPVSERILCSWIGLVSREIESLVDMWDNAQDLPLDYNLRLQRVKLRRRYYLKLCDHWIWLDQ